MDDLRDFWRYFRAEPVRLLRLVEIVSAVGGASACGVGIVTAAIVLAC